MYIFQQIAIFINQSLIHNLKRKLIMKKYVVAVILTLFLTQFSSAQTSGLGVGIILGEPTGLSVKNFISQSVAIDGAVAGVQQIR